MWGGSHALPLPWTFWWFHNQKWNEYKGNTKLWGDQQGLSDLGPAPSGTTSLSCLPHTGTHTCWLSPWPCRHPAAGPCPACNMPPPTDNLRLTPSFLQVSAQRLWFLKYALPAFTFHFILFFSMRFATTQYRFFVCLLDWEVFKARAFVLLITIWRT